MDETAIDEGWTTLRSTLIDVVRDVALAADAPAADHAGRALVRLLAIDLGHPLPEPVERDGGLVNVIYGKPIKPEPPTTSPLPGAAPARPPMPLPARRIRDTPQA